VTPVLLWTDIPLMVPRIYQFGLPFRFRNFKGIRARGWAD
jgi:hypothetical protein